MWAMERDAEGGWETGNLFGVALLLALALFPTLTN